MLRIAKRSPVPRGLSLLAATRTIATTPNRRLVTGSDAPNAIPEAAAQPQVMPFTITRYNINERKKTKENPTPKPKENREKNVHEQQEQLDLSNAWSKKQLRILQKRNDMLLAVTGSGSSSDVNKTTKRMRTIREIALGVPEQTHYDIHQPVPAESRTPRNIKGFRLNERQNLLELTFATGTPAQPGHEFTASTSTLWVRDLCQCSHCRTPASGQKEVMTHDLDARPRITRISAVNTAGETAATLEAPNSTDPAQRSLDQSEATLIPEGQDIAKLVITWDDGPQFASKRGGIHESEFEPRDLLEKMAGLFGPQAQAMPQRLLWDRKRIESLQKPVQYSEWMAKTGENASDKTPEFYRALNDLHQLGLVVIDGVPDVETAVRDIALEVGHVQPTFYGELFDVVSKPPTEAENVAYTNVHLGLHQDLLYMNDSPRVQLLHCLRNDCDGGESLFSDSMRAAIEIQLRFPYYALALAKFPVPYHYERNGNYYYNERPVFEIDRKIGASAADQHPSFNPTGQPRSYEPYNALIRHTAWSPPFQGIFQPLTFFEQPRHRVRDGPDEGKNKDLKLGSTDPKTMTLEEQGVDYHVRFGLAYRRSQLEYWHEAVRVFEDILNSERNLFEFKLKPGQCVLFDNRRILHGRRQFTPVKEAVVRDYPRWLKGTYLSDQVFRSRVTDMVVKGNAPKEAVPPAKSWTAEHALVDEQVQVLDILKSQGTPLW